MDKIHQRKGPKTKHKFGTLRPLCLSLPIYPLGMEWLNQLTGMGKDPPVTPWELPFLREGPCLRALPYLKHSPLADEKFHYVRSRKFRKVKELIFFVTSCRKFNPHIVPMYVSMYGSERQAPMEPGQLFFCHFMSKV
jgi:hypothetical protein